MAERLPRKLAAILYADVAGYSRLTGEDEEATHRTLSAYLDTITAMIQEHGGTVMHFAGDAVLADFPSVVNAFECAVAVQRDLKARNQTLAEERRLQFRIGINLGDVIVDRNEIYGDGVNVAARLESLAAPGGICISDMVRQGIEGKLDIGLKDLGEQSVKNIARPVRAYQVLPDLASGSKSDSVEPAQLAVSDDEPSIAVLPFDNLSDDPEQEIFADGLVEDIITTLSKIGGLRVIARNSTFVFKGRPIDVRDAAKQLGVRYVLEGSVRKSTNRFRISVQLIDAKSGSHVWAERYDRTIDDIFAVQDEITMVVATEMQVRLTEGEQARLRYTTTSNVEAWTHWVQGVSYYRKAVTEENSAGALACWKRALALDPSSASLNAMVSLKHYSDARFGWWDERETALGKASTYAARALELDPQNADANVASSLVLLAQRRYDEAVLHVRTALKVAPGSADVATFACFVLACSGHPAEAVSHGERAMKLSPNYPAYYLGILGDAYRLAGRTDEAIAAFIAHNDRSPGFGLTDLVITYQQIGQPEEAKQTAEQLLAVRREFTVGAWASTQYRADKSRLEADIAALLGAGLPMS